MTTRFKKSRQAFSLALAIWFVLLSASLHALHKHSGTLWIGDGIAGLPCDEGYSVPSSCLAYLSDSRDQDQPATEVSSLCPVCLFLAKTKAERAGAPPRPAPKDEGPGYATCSPSELVISVDLPSTAPRAPPCQPAKSMIRSHSS